MTIDAIDKLDNQPVCHCGHCRTAVEIALADFQRHYGGTAEQPGCLHWYLAIVAAHGAIAQLILGNFPQAEQNFDRVGMTLTEKPVLDALVNRLQDIVDARGATKQ